MDEDVFYGDDFGGLEDLDEDTLRAYLEGVLSGNMYPPPIPVLSYQC